MIVLPKEKNKPKINNPRFLILYGKPKSGKTTLVSQLENCLIIDLEGGSEFLEALSVQARTINDLGEISRAIQEQITATGKKPYKYIAIDNATRLEELCLGYAKTLYVYGALYGNVYCKHSLNFWNIFPISTFNVKLTVLGKKIRS